MYVIDIFRQTTVEASLNVAMSHSDRTYLQKKLTFLRDVYNNMSSTKKC